MRENLSNFATTTLVAPGLAAATGAGGTFTLTDASQFPVTSGGVAPLAAFLLIIDTEVLSATRAAASNTLTVVARGLEGTSAQLHNTGATVSVMWTAGMVARQYAANPDTHHPDVPPLDRLDGSYRVPSSWDDEFDSATSSAALWSLSPALGAGGTLSVNADRRSCLYFRRGDFDTTTYLYTQPFVPSGATGSWKVTARLYHGGRLTTPQGTTGALLAALGVSDATVLPGSGDALTDNQLRITHLLDPALQLATSSSSVPLLTSGIVQAFSTTAGLPASTPNPTLLGATLDNGYHYLRLQYDGPSQTLEALAGTGYSWVSLGCVTRTINVQLLFLRFQALSSASTQQEVTIDWLRVQVS